MGQVRMELLQARGGSVGLGITLVKNRGGDITFDLMCSIKVAFPVVWGCGGTAPCSIQFRVFASSLDLETPPSYSISFQRGSRRRFTLTSESPQRRACAYRRAASTSA